MLFRQSSCISDVTIDLECLEGVTFAPNHQFLPGLVVTALTQCFLIRVLYLSKYFNQKS